jgi:peptidoglycan hydrolase CwlO-like protein
MTRQLLAVVLITVFLSTAIGFTIGWAANPESANSANSATPQQQMVKQLKMLNSQVAALNAKTGNTQTATGSVRGLLTIICDYTAPVNCKPH